MARLPSPTVARSTVQPARYRTHIAACSTQCQGAGQQMHLEALNAFHLFDKQISAVSVPEMFGVLSCHSARYR